MKELNVNELKKVAGGNFWDELFGKGKGKLKKPPKSGLKGGGGFGGGGGGSW